jgi:hypothetical protein
MFLQRRWNLGGGGRTFSFGSSEALDFAGLFPCWYAEGETAVAYIGGCGFGDHGDEGVQEGGASVGGCAFYPFPCKAETAFTLGGFVVVVFVFAVGVVDGIVVVAVTSCGDALLNVERVGVVCVGQGP